MIRGRIAIHSIFGEFGALSIPPLACPIHQTNSCETAMNSLVTSLQEATEETEFIKKISPFPLFAPVE
jgi:hypothetical protein